MAKGMKLVVDAREDFNDEPILDELLSTLSAVAAKVASLLRKLQDIVLISGC